MSIRTQLIVSTVLISLIGSLSIGLLLNRQARQYDAEVRQRYGLILKLSVHGVVSRISNALLIGQTEDIRRAVQGLREDSVLSFAHVVDGTGRVVASTDASMEGRPLPESMWDELRREKAPHAARVVWDGTPHILYYHPMFVLGPEDFMGGIVTGLSLEGYESLKRRLQWTSVGWTVLLMSLLTGFLYAFTWRSIFQPLLRMSEAIHGVLERRDLRVRVPVRRQDEIGALGESFNILLEFLHGSLQNLRRTAQHMDEIGQDLQRYAQQLMDGAAQQIRSVEMTHAVLDATAQRTEAIGQDMAILTQFTEETSAYFRQMEVSTDLVNEGVERLTTAIRQNSQAVSDIAATVSNVAHTAEELSSSAMQAVTAVTELNMSIREIETSAEEAAQLADRMVEDARAGQAAVQRTLEGMVQIQETFDRTEQTMSRLLELTEVIDRISGDIRAIAAQTHILSINASILAAQAGEHGRAFVVIVRQIQTMADQTSGYTREINQLLQEIRTRSVETRQAMTESRTAIEQGLAVAQQAQASLETLLRSTRQVGDYVLKIAKATKEQVRGSSQIREATHHVNEVASALNEVIHDLDRVAHAIDASSGELRSFAEELQGTMKAQAQESRQMTASIERIVRLIDSVAQALEAQRSSVQTLVTVMQEIRRVSEISTSMVQELRHIVRNVQEQNAALNAQVAQFQL
jgi:methyl-accepting chemotaxis protein